MNEFIKQLLSLSLSGSLLVLMLLFLKKLYKNRLSKCWQYYIFLAAALRFLLPFAPDAALAATLLQIPRHAIQSMLAGSSTTDPADSTGAANFAHSHPSKQPQEATGLQPSQQQSKSPDIQPANQPPGSTGILPRQQPLSLASQLSSSAGLLPLPDFGIASGCLFLVWLFLALALAAKKIKSYQRFCYYIRTVCAAVDEAELLNLLASCEETCKVRTPVALYHSPHLASPVMTGFFHPCIAIPEKNLSKQELSLIFMHELYHYRRRDMFYKWLVQAVVCIHWFNPFAYLLEKETNHACELSCDEAVLRALPAEGRKAYGDVLLYCSKAALFQKNSISSLTLSEGAKQLKERLGAIMKVQQPTKKMKTATVSLTAVVCFISAAIGAYAAPVRPSQALSQASVPAGPQAPSQEATVPGAAKGSTSDKLPEAAKKVLSLKVQGYQDYTLQQFSSYITERYEADHSLWKARQQLWKALDEKARQNLTETDAQFLYTTLPCTESESAYPRDRTGSIPPSFSGRYELPYAKHGTTVSIEWAVQYETKDPQLSVGQRDRLVLNVKNGMAAFIKGSWKTADIGTMGYLKKVRKRLGQLVEENNGPGLKMTVYQCMSDGKST